MPRRNGSPGLLLWVSLAVVALAAPVSAQDSPWRMWAAAGVVEADGHFTTVRLNGKRVTSDIDAGPFVAFGLERRLGGRWSALLGYEGSGSRTYSVAQDFPDGTDFTSSDVFSYNAVVAGAVLHLVRGGAIDLAIAPNVSWAWFDDISLDAAGPPFDRSTPLDVDVIGRLGVGLGGSVAVPLGDSGLALVGRAGVTIQRIAGDFPADPSLPGSEGSIDTPFNPAYLTLGLAYAF